MTNLTDDFTKDEERVNWLLTHLPRPWKVTQGKRNKHTAWVIEDAEGRVIKFQCRGMMCLIAKAVNEMGAK